MKNKLLMRASAFTISAVMILTTLTGCANKPLKSNSSQITTSVTTKEIADSISESISAESEAREEAVKISFDPDDYAGDLDAFVYGLIVTEYELCYNVFNAAVELPDGETVYGIGYTDYADRYDSDDGKIFFPAGFISLIGEPKIQDTETDKGLEIIDLEYEDSDRGFVLAYDTEPFTEHCVIWGQYLQYGVDENGEITYKAAADTGDYDEELGSLYSYDTEKYILNFDFNDSSFEVSSLSAEPDYAAVEAEINRMIEEQDRNFSKVEIETIAAEAPQYLANALLATQAETFMGYDVSELIEKAKQLDANECMKLTDHGIVIEFDNDAPADKEKLSKWLVGISCGVLVIGSVALDVFVPALRPVSGAISGAAIEVFVQVVIENQTLENVNWKKVAVSAVSGAVVAWLCPLAAQAAAQKVAGTLGKTTIEICGQTIAAETLSKLAGYGTLTVSNALVSGITNAAFSCIDGETAEEQLDAFITGAAVGAAFTAVGSAMGEIVQHFKPGQKILNAFSKKAPNSWLTKATQSLAAGSEKLTAFIGEHQVHLKNTALEEILSPSSVYVAAKAATNSIKINNYNRTMFNQLPADSNLNFKYYDSSGKRLMKADLLQNGLNAKIVIDLDTCEDELIKYAENSFKVIDGDIDFGDASVFSFISKDGISANRTNNYSNFDEQLAEIFNNDKELIPAEFLETLKDIDIITESDIKTAIKQAKLTYHERANGEVQLVDTILHKKLGHSGGVAQAKVYAMIETVKKNFFYISSSDVKNVFGSLLENAA